MVRRRSRERRCGYPSDILAQPPLKWLMTKAASLGLKFRFDLTTDGPNPTAPVADSYMRSALRS